MRLIALTLLFVWACARDRLAQVSQTTAYDLCMASTIQHSACVPDSACVNLSQRELACVCCEPISGFSIIFLDPNHCTERIQTYWAEVCPHR